MKLKHDAAGLSSSGKDMMFFMIAVCALSFAYGLYDSVFNNFLKDNYQLTGMQRSILELPRELPGMLVAFVSMIFAFLCARRLAVLAMLFSAAALILMFFLNVALSPFLMILFLYSLGQHIFLPLSSAIALDLSNQSNEGKTLGNVNSLRSAAVVLGSLAVFFLFRFFPVSYRTVFFIAAGFMLIAALSFALMKPAKKTVASGFFAFKKEYRLYYLLSVVYGCRKQIFLTFAPWVLVSVFGKSTEVLASLIFAGGIAGIIFQPLLGRAIDRFGEKFVLMAESVLLVLVCAGYSLGSVFFDNQTAFVIASVCYVADQMLMSVTMARATYLRKISVDPADVTPALTLAVSLDHVPSILIAMAGGFLWTILGYRAVFGLGVIFALVNILLASKIRIPAKK